MTTLIRFSIKNSHGQSILEIIIAMAIFSLISASLTSLILGSFASMRRAAEIEEAEGFADEGVEAVKYIKSRDWNELAYGRSGITISNDNKWQFLGEGTEELLNDKYSRTIDFTPVFRNPATKEMASSSDPGAYLDNQSKIVKVIVSWNNDSLSPNSVERSFCLTNWELGDWAQNDWSGGSASSTDYWNEDNKNKFDSASGDIIASSSIVLAASSSQTQGEIISLPFNTGAASRFKSVSWSETISEECGNGCRIKLQIETAPDNNGSPGDWQANWCGPLACDGNDFYATSTSEQVNPVHDGGQWIRYKAILTGDGTSTPELKEVKISYK